MTKQGNILDPEGNKIIPNTSSAAVYDVAKSQTLADTLVDTPDKEALGYPDFSESSAYVVDDIVYHENKLWRFTSPHAAGAWDATQVEQVSVKSLDDETQVVIEHKANIDGYYETLGAGSATNLKGNTEVSADIAYRTAGGSADIASGSASITSIKGNTVVMNQLSPEIVNLSKQEDGVSFSITDDGFSITAVVSGVESASYAYIQPFLPLIQGHKYIAKGCPKGGSDTTYYATNALYTGYGKDTGSGVLFTADSTNLRYSFDCVIITAVDGTYVFKPQLFDLTLIYGAGNEPETAEEFEADYFSWFGKELTYEAYNAGSLIPFKPTGLKTIGFNAFNLSTNTANVLANNEYQVVGTYTSLTLNGTAITPDSDGKFTPTETGDVTVVGGDATTCIHLVWSGKRDGDYEAYWDSTLSLPITTLTGKLNGEGDSVAVFPDGMKKAGSVYDEIVGNKAIKRVGVVDLGSLDASYWKRYTTGEENSYEFELLISSVNGKRSHNIKSNKFYNIGAATADNEMDNYDGGMCWNGSNTNNGTFKFFKSEYKNYSTTDFKAAMSGVYLYYELATPLEYTLDDFSTPKGYRVDDFGTEEIIPHDGTTAPMSTEILYGINAADTIRRLPENFVSATQEQTFTEQEKAQARENIDVWSKSEGARVDGDYETLGAGSATNLKGNTEVSADIAYRTAGGSADIASGSASIASIKGNTVVMNQLVEKATDNPGMWTLSSGTWNEEHTIYTVTNATTNSSYFYTTINVVSGHKYFVQYLFQGTAGGTMQSNYAGSVVLTGSWQYLKNIATFTTATAIVNVFPLSNVSELQFKDEYMLIDLTLIYGSGNEPTTVEEFEQDYFEWFGKELTYEPYNAGTLIPFKPTGLKTIGFNAFNLSTNTANVLANNEYQVVGTYTSLTLNGTAITPDSDGKFTPTETGDVTVVGGDDTTCIHLVWSGKRDGDYEAYWDSTLDLPITTLTGKLNGEGDSVTIFPDGMKRAGSVYDEIVGNKAIKRVGVVDLGSQNWTRVKNNSWSYQAFYFYTNIGGIKKELNSDGLTTISNTLLPIYDKETKVNVFALITTDKTYHVNASPHVTGDFEIKDSSYTDAATFKTAMSGVYLYYELATPLEYTLDDFSTPKGYRVDDFGTEEVLPHDGTTAPMSANIIYGINAADTIRRLPDNYVSATQVQDFTSEEKAQARENIDVLSADDAARKDGYYTSLVAGGAETLVDPNGSTTLREFTFDTAGGDTEIATGSAVIKKMRGNTLVWNQLISTPTATLNFPSGSITPTIQSGATLINGHKYLYTTTLSEAVTQSAEDRFMLKFGSTYMLSPSHLTAEKKVYRLFTFSGTTATNDLVLWITNYHSSISTSITVDYGNLFDLTLMFGVGNEPATVAEFEAMFPLPYYAYDAGSLLSFNGEGLKTVGFNQWDEEWEVGGISTNNGAKTTTAGYYRSANFISVFPSTVYYIKAPVSMSLLFYDKNQSYIGYFIYYNATFTTPSGAYYMRFRNYNADAWTPYNNDICINFSWDNGKDGTYEAYEEHSISYDISAIVDGESNQLFPNGLLSAGSVYDEVTSTKAVKRIGMVDLGSLTWTKVEAENDTYDYYEAELTATSGGTFISTMYINGIVTTGGGSDKYGYLTGTTIRLRNLTYADAAAFKTAMNGVMLYYPLATTVEVTFASQLNLSYHVNEQGPEMLLPENTSTPTTTPALFDVVYGINAVQTLRNLPKNFLAQDDLTRLLTAMGSALGFTYTKTWNESTQQWSFTITPNESASSN